MLKQWLSRLLLLCIINFFIPESLSAQVPTRLTIEKIYELTGRNYPLIKQRNLVSLTKTLTVSNASKGYLPVININGLALAR